MKWRPRTRVGNAGAIGGLIGIVVVCLLAITWVVGNLVLLNWGDSADLETGAGTVDKKTAEAFLSAHDADWRTALETERGIGSGSVQNLPPEARCYFVTSARADGGSEQSVGLTACGPVRRLGTAEGAVWDIARVEGASGNQVDGTGQADDAGQVGLRLVGSGAAAWQRSVPRPTDGKLFRPDDQEPPKGADQLAAPPAPPAPPRLVQVQVQTQHEPQGQVGGVGVQVGKVKLAEHNEPLIAPDVTVTLTGLGTTDTIGTGALTKAPAAGEKFIVARFTTAKTRDPVVDPASDPARDSISGDAGQRTKTTFAVAADGESRPVDLIGSETAGSPGSTSPTGSRGVPGGGYLVASVPIAAKDVALTATTHGVTQSLSLLTGKRTSTNTAAAYYRPNRSVTLNQRLPAKTIKHGRDFATTYTVTVTKAGLTAWDPEKGWAPAGQAWLRFRYDETWAQPSQLYEVTWNPEFFTATADGRPITIPADYNTYTRTVTAPVPAEVKTVRITVTATFTFREKNIGIEYAQPKSGSADFGVLTANASFG